MLLKAQHGSTTQHVRSIVRKGSLVDSISKQGSGVTSILKQSTSCLSKRVATFADTSHKMNDCFMPSESALHQCTLMAFPSPASMFHDKKILKQARFEVASIANAISKFEPVYLYAREEFVKEARSMVGSNVTIKPAIVEQLWIRDSGPTFVKEGKSNRLAAIDFNFNYWGQKFSPKGDETLAKQVAVDLAIPRIHSPITAEGGGIVVDGEGTFLGTESCIINDNRNPGKSKQEIEVALRTLLGVEKFIWVPGLKSYDVTDYHIDALARFVRPGVVIVSEPAVNDSSAYRDCYEETMEILSRSTDARGRSLELHRCREPKGIPGSKEEDFCASYINFSLVNGGVIMPKYGDKKTDDAALQLLKDLYPERECVQVLISALPMTGGGVHCATQHVPL